MRRQLFPMFHGIAAIGLLAFMIAGTPRLAIAADDVPKAAAAKEVQKPQEKNARQGLSKAKKKEKPKAANAKPIQKKTQDAAKDAKNAQKKKAKPKAAAVKAKPKNRVGAAFGNLIKGAFEALRGGGRPADMPDAVVEKADKNDPVIKQFEKQYARQFQQLYKTELHFIRIVCQPTKQQFETISADGEKVKKYTMRKFALYQKRMRRGFRAGEQRNGPGDPRTILAQGLIKLVKTTLSADQAASYQKEIERRRAARKRVAKLNILAKLDKRLVLTRDQRGQLSKVLDTNWKESWNNVQMLMYGDQYFPTLSDNKVLPILNKSQKDVWRGMTKQSNIYFGFNIFMVNGVQIDDEVWDDEQPDAKDDDADNAAAKVEAKK